jgi:AraC-like DNA-binding protein
MLLRDFLPHFALREFVKCYRVVHFIFDKNTPFGHKPYTPRPENCLAFYPRDREKVVYADSGKVVENLPVVLIGQHTVTTNRFINPDFLVLQIHFQPGALHRLTGGMPLFELNNVYMAAETVFSKEILVVNEKLYHAPNYGAMVGILNDFMLNLVKKGLKDAHPLDQAAQLMFDRQGAMNLDWLRREACLSVKQLERKFKDRTGVNPKVLNRLIRFDKAYRTKNAKPNLDWFSVAIECDYYDYQHLVRDYKDFTGLSPNAFLALERQAPEQALGMAEQFYEVSLK